MYVYLFKKNKTEGAVKQSGRGNGYNRNESTENFCKNDRILLTEKCEDAYV